MVREAAELRVDLLVIGFGKGGKTLAARWVGTAGASRWSNSRTGCTAAPASTSVASRRSRSSTTRSAAAQAALANGTGRLSNRRER